MKQTPYTKSTVERITLDTSVRYKPENAEAIDGRCKDLSVGGLYLKSAYVFNVDDVIAVTFSLSFDGQQFDVSCNARVAWSNQEQNKRKPDYPAGVGLEFKGLSEDRVALLARFVDSYDKNKKMNMVCAWCGSHLGMRKGPDGKVSHGICVRCKERHFKP